MGAHSLSLIPDPCYTLPKPTPSRNFNIEVPVPWIFVVFVRVVVHKVVVIKSIVSHKTAPHDVFSLAFI